MLSNNVVHDEFRRAGKNEAGATIDQHQKKAEKKQPALRPHVRPHFREKPDQSSGSGGELSRGAFGSGVAASTSAGVRSAPRRSAFGMESRASHRTSIYCLTSRI